MKTHGSICYKSFINQSDLDDLRSNTLITDINVIWKGQHIRFSFHPATWKFFFLFPQVVYTVLFSPGHYILSHATSLRAPSFQWREEISGELRKVHGPPTMQTKPPTCVSGSQTTSHATTRHQSYLTCIPYHSRYNNTRCRIGWAATIYILSCTCNEVPGMATVAKMIS